MKESIVENFASQFEDVDPSVVTMEANFRNIEGWIFAALSIIAMVDEYTVEVRERYKSAKQSGSYSIWSEKLSNIPYRLRCLAQNSICQTEKIRP